ncbi:hypothetical protein ACHAXR_006514 [Thalassiosira sp. AJA248-18]
MTSSLPKSGKGKGLPPKPYTEYTIFFRLERYYLVQSAGIIDEEIAPLLDPNHHDPIEFPRPAKYQDLVLPPFWYFSSSKAVIEKKRKHRKRTGESRMDMKTLSKTISSSWRKCDKAVVEYCRKLAKADAKRYYDLVEGLLAAEVKRGHCVGPLGKNGGGRSRTADGLVNGALKKPSDRLDGVTMTPAESRKYSELMNEIQQGSREQLARGTGRYKQGLISSLSTGYKPPGDDLDAAGALLSMEKNQQEKKQETPIVARAEAQKGARFFDRSQAIQDIIAAEHRALRYFRDRPIQGSSSGQRSSDAIVQGGPPLMNRLHSQFSEEILSAASEAMSRHLQYPNMNASFLPRSEYPLSGNHPILSETPMQRAQDRMMLALQAQPTVPHHPSSGLSGLENMAALSSFNSRHSIASRNAGPANENTTHPSSQISAPPVRSNVQAHHERTTASSHALEQPRRPKSDNADSLSITLDAGVLDEVHIFLRRYCIQLLEDTSNIVGFRCYYCKDAPQHQRTSQSICFPSKRETIYEDISSELIWKIAHAFLQSRKPNTTA